MNEAVDRIGDKDYFNNMVLKGDSNQQMSFLNNLAKSQKQILQSGKVLIRAWMQGFKFSHEGWAQTRSAFMSAQQTEQSVIGFSCLTGAGPANATDTKRSTIAAVENRNILQSSQIENFDPC